MDTLALLKKASDCVPYLKFEDLEIDKKYPVERFELLSDTKFGACIVVYIAGDMLYLPKRFTKIIKAEDVENLNEKKHVLIYKGKEEDKGNRVMLEFELDKSAGVDMDMDDFKQ